MGYWEEQQFQKERRDKANREKAFEAKFKREEIKRDYIRGLIRTAAKMELLLNYRWSDVWHTS